MKRREDKERGRSKAGESREKREKWENIKRSSSEDWVEARRRRRSCDRDIVG